MPGSPKALKSAASGSSISPEHVRRRRSRGRMSQMSQQSQLQKEQNQMNQQSQNFNQSSQIGLASSQHPPLVNTATAAAAVVGVPVVGSHGGVVSELPIPSSDNLTATGCVEAQSIEDNNLNLMGSHSAAGGSLSTSVHEGPEQQLSGNPGLPLLRGDSPVQLPLSGPY